MERDGKEHQLEEMQARLAISDWEGIALSISPWQEVVLDVALQRIKWVLTHLKCTAMPSYDVLIDLTGVDFLTPIPHTQVIYWLHCSETLERIRVVTEVARGESIPSVVALWEGADWYERELFDFFGVRVEGHPDLKRLLMPDDWTGHPLRRDYPLTEEAVEFVHDVHPKVPSEIIHLRQNQRLVK